MLLRPHVQQLEPGQLPPPRLALGVAQQIGAAAVVVGEAPPELIASVLGSGSRHRSDPIEHMFVSPPGKTRACYRAESEPAPIGVSPCASATRPWTIMAAALEPAATAFATDGTACVLTSPAAESPGTLVWSIASTSTASTAMAPGGGGRAELLGECGALVQGHGHEQPAARALAAVGEDDGRQRAVRAAQPGDRALVDRDPRRAQPLGVLRVELGGPVGEQRHVVAPDAQQKRSVDTRLAPVEHSERLVADLPAVAERAMEHRAAPPLHDPGSAGKR